jgi:hypothetical protein
VIQLNIRPLNMEAMMKLSNAGKIVFPPIYFSRLRIDFKFPDSDPIGLDEISFLVCCVLE